MRTIKFVLSATLLAAIAAGCGDSDSGAAGNGGTGGGGGSGGTIPDKVCDGETLPNYECATGEACVMSGCRVEGNVMVAPGSEIILQQTNVMGSLVGSTSPTPAMGGEANIELIDSSVRQGIDVPFSTAIRFESADIDDDVKLEDASGGLVVLDCNIDGNIQVKKATFLRAEDNTVNGNIQLQEMTLGDTSSVIRANTVQGNIQVDDSSSTEFFIEDNFADGNLQASKNTGSLTIESNNVDDLQVFENTASGPHTISGNTVRGNLQCKENTPKPTGGNNNVSGDKEDQCSDL